MQIRMSIQNFNLQMEKNKLDEIIPPNHQKELNKIGEVEFRKLKNLQPKPTLDKQDSGSRTMNST